MFKALPKFTRKGSKGGAKQQPPPSTTASLPAAASRRPGAEQPSAAAVVAPTMAPKAAAAVASVGSGPAFMTVKPECLVLRVPESAHAVRPFPYACVHGRPLRLYVFGSPEPGNPALTRSTDNACTSRRPGRRRTAC